MKKKIIVLLIIIGGVLITLLIVLIVLGNLFMDSLPESKEREKFVEEFTLELKGKIIDIKSDGALRIACLKVEDSNYKEYRNENQKFFIRVKDSLAVIIYSTKVGNNPRYHLYSIGSELLINFRNNKKVLEIKDKDTLDYHPILLYPTRDYLKNSCIPD